jgi:hypothetical protein
MIAAGAFVTLSIFSGCGRGFLGGVLAMMIGFVLLIVPFWVIAKILDWLDK